jgi:hypothetical protein
VTTLWQRVRDSWSVPRFVALVVVILAVFAFKFIATKPSTGPVFSRAQDRNSVLTVAGNVYDGVEAEHRTNGLPVPVARTVAEMQKQYRDADERGVHVIVDGANIRVTFPKEPAVCVWVPVIVYGPKEPAIVSC